MSSPVKLNLADPKEVIPNVENLIKDLHRNVPVGVLRLKYRDFCSRYPSLFNMVCRDKSIDMNKLKRIFDDHKVIQQNPEKLNDTFVKMDRDFAKEYVPENILNHEIDMRERFGTRVSLDGEGSMEDLGPVFQDSTTSGSASQDSTASDSALLTTLGSSLQDSTTSSPTKDPK